MEWQNTIKAMIPSIGHSLIEDGKLMRAIRSHTNRILQLDDGYVEGIA
jgi:hypothetical protein